MEWNLRTPSEWDWENLAMFSSKTTEINKQVHHEIEGERVENGSLYSSTGAGFSSSDLGYRSSSKSSISASIDSSLKEGLKTFSAVDGFPKACFQEEEVAGVDDNGNFSTLGASVNSSESMIGLKLGKRTYFENMCAAGTTKTTAFSAIPTSSATTARRSRASYQSTQAPRCQVEGCNLDLKSAKDYHRRHRICETHSKSPRVIVAGLERRFCQQCSRFHDLLEFDDKKRSCRKRLSDHNARRRRPRQEAILSSSLYDGRQKMNLLLNRVPSNPPWHNVCNFKTIHSGDSLSRPVKTAGIHRQPHFSGDEMHNSISMPHLDSGRILSFQSTTPRIPSHDLAPCGISSNSDVSPDLRHALSLLSTNSWGLNEPEPTSLKQFVHAGQSRAAKPVMHAEQQGVELASSQHLRMEQPTAMSCLQSLDLHSSGNSQFQEFQLFKAPYESGCFYPNRIN